MALPGNVTRVTLSGTFLDTDGAACAGKVYFTPSVSRLRDPTADTVIIAKTVDVTLDGSGAFSVLLVATDDADVIPQNWVYTVREIFTSPAGHDREYDIAVPSASSTLNLADVAPV